MHLHDSILLMSAFLISISPALGAGQIHEVSYSGSDKPGELAYSAIYRVWIPDGVARLRGVIIHQHGCGKGACDGGLTAADDLHWQALAKKWDCALLGPSYGQADGQDCKLWYDPRKGSRAKLLQGLQDLSELSGHPELASLPWCLWGHSGGGSWASLMQTLDPERIVAIWLRSGTAMPAWEKGDIAKPDQPDSIYQIPVVCNPGAKEKGDSRFNGAWTGALAMFQAYRAKGAPIAFAPDPRTAHECGDSRYLAIPFFDACLAARLPEQGTSLRPLNLSKGWLARLEGDTVSEAGLYEGDIKEASWFPSESVAKAWLEYSKTASVSDPTSPPAPFGLKATKTDVGTELTWDALADFESGLRGFLIQRDGKTIATLPEKPIGKFGRPLFQSMSYHDTPEKPLPIMKYVDREPGQGSKYQVIAVNSVGLESPACIAATAP